MTEKWERKSSVLTLEFSCSDHVFSTPPVHSLHPTKPPPFSQLDSLSAAPLLTALFFPSTSMQVFFSFFFQHSTRCHWMKRKFRYRVLDSGHAFHHDTYLSAFSVLLRILGVGRYDEVENRTDRSELSGRPLPMLVIRHSSEYQVTLEVSTSRGGFFRWVFWWMEQQYCDWELIAGLSFVALEKLVARVWYEFGIISVIWDWK